MLAQLDLADVPHHHPCDPRPPFCFCSRFTLFAPSTTTPPPPTTYLTLRIPSSHPFFQLHVAQPSIGYPPYSHPCVDHSSISRGPEPPTPPGFLALGAHKQGWPVVPCSAARNLLARLASALRRRHGKILFTLLFPVRSDKLDGNSLFSSVVFFSFSSSLSLFAFSF